MVEVIFACEVIVEVISILHYLNLKYHVNDSLISYFTITRL